MRRPWPPSSSPPSHSPGAASATTIRSPGARAPRAATSRRRRSSAFHPPQLATRSACRAPTPPPTPPESRARSSRRSRTPTGRPRSCSWTAATGSPRSPLRCWPGRRSAHPSCSPTAAVCPPSPSDTLGTLKPRGSDLAKDAQVIRIGDGVARPSGFKTAVVEGDDAYERAAAWIASSRRRAGAVEDASCTPADEADYAMPAAAWAARSGDTALPVKSDSIPDPIRRALREHDRPNVYVLGPERVVSKKVVARLSEGTRRFREQDRRPSPVENAIAFGALSPGELRLGVWRCPATTSRWRAPTALSTWPPRRRSPPGRVRPAPADRPHRRSPEATRELLPQRATGLRGRPRPGGVQPSVDPGRRNTISLRAQARLDRINELIPVQATAP